MAELISIHPDNPQERLLRRVVECLKDGGLIIFPTDTVYALGCDLFQSRTFERLCRLKGVKPEKANFSVLCHNLSNLSDYTRQVSNPVYKIMRKTLPGPYTFILPASGLVPRIFLHKKKTIGIRVPNHAVTLSLIEMLGNPLVSTSVHDDDEIIEYATSPELIAEKYDKTVDLVIDSGQGGIIPSTILDCTGDEIELIREGAGAVDF
jgi:tRNA threonylcarbamoyl adenosine modification protein (Sua5/YciO/YrdC/YwlC family)